MIGEFRIADAPQLFDLLRTNFPEEEQVYGTRPEAWQEVVRRIHRPSVRIVVALARLVRRPIYRFFTIKEGERLVATSLLSFAPGIGYISTVMVDAGSRRRGYARRLLHRCHEETARFHRPNVVLDVLSDNAPARALYLSEGYRPLRTATLYTLPLSDASEAEAGVGSGTVRPFAKSDQRALAQIVERAVPADIARILPSPGRRLTSSPTIEQVLGSESEGWVLEESGRPVAWVSATSSKFMGAAGFATPIVDPSASSEGLRALFARAIEWCRVRRSDRIVCRVPSDNAASMRAIAEERFTPTLTFDTLYRPLP